MFPFLSRVMTWEVMRICASPGWICWRACPLGMNRKTATNSMTARVLILAVPLEASNSAEE